jgi:ATP-dependent helicase/nuclease subunit A
VAIQGVVDLAVILPDAIWILDFKTDQVQGAQIDEHVRRYEPQLRLYGWALESIYRRKVAHRWLHFLVPGQTVAV